MTQDTTTTTSGISIKKVGDNWTLFAQNEPRMSSPNLAEMRAYVYGVWDGITGCTGERPNHVCPVHSENGMLIDMMRSIPEAG